MTARLLRRQLFGSIESFDVVVHVDDLVSETFPFREDHILCNNGQLSEGDEMELLGLNLDKVIKVILY